MAAAGGRRMKAFAEFVLVAATGYSVYYILTFILRRLENLDPEKPDRDHLAKRSSAVLRRLDQNDLRLNGSSGSHASSNNSKSRSRGSKDVGPRERMVLSVYEQKIVTEVVAPEDIAVSFADIGGLDSIIEELRESVILPLTQPDLFAAHSSLLSAPKGVLLYGPPGCGKTMLAKALAKESQACFINLHISTLTEKWYGDSNKMVNAVFSLARKLQPCIIFIDEIDAVLRARSAQDHEASAMVKAEFMTHWDGLLTGQSSGGTTNSSSLSESGSEAGGGGGGGEEPPRIMVLGATNRIGDIDEAILRRLPKKFPISLPDAPQRERILRLILTDTKLDHAFSFDDLVRRTAGFSGSDLKEACRDAAMVPVREIIRKRKEEEEARRKRIAAGDDLVSSSGEEDEKARKRKVEPRGVRNSDFFRKESGGKWAGSVAAMSAGVLGAAGVPHIPGIPHMSPIGRFPEPGGGYVDREVPEIPVVEITAPED